VLIYRRTGNLRADQLLLGHTKIESTVRYLGIEVDDAIENWGEDRHLTATKYPNQRTWSVMLSASPIAARPTSANVCIDAGDAQSRASEAPMAAPSQQHASASGLRHGGSPTSSRKPDRLRTTSVGHCTHKALESCETIQCPTFR
jgi:hypothetical protein